MNATRTRNSGDGGKRFVCTHPGCDRRFTRAEHLQRHALNHTRGQESICQRCSAVFKRPDLLERHMNRHRQKDAEAGGAGCGVLDTRKRSWKAADGTVVEKRPHPSHRTRAAPSENHQPQGQDLRGRANFPSSTIPSAQGREQRPDSGVHFQHPISPLSDPRSSEPDRSSAEYHDDYPPEAYDATENSFRFNSLGSDLNNQPYLVSPYDDQPWIDAFPPVPPALPGMNNCLSANPGQLQYEQLFQPDTAHSFNMPYTTALDYNWLFNVDETMAAETVNLEASQQHIQGSDNAPAQRFDQTQNQRVTITQSQPSVVVSASRHTVQQWPGSANAVQNRTAINPVDSDHRTNSYPVPTWGRGQNQRPSISSAGMAPESNPPEPERPLSILLKPVMLPKMDASVRQKLLTVVEGSNPCLPDQRYSIWDHPLLSLESLQSYLDLFFTKFNTAYPLIHMASFAPTEIEPLLLLSVILLGATYSEKDAHQVAVCIHDVMRPSIFAHAGFSARAELWTLQTILLVECFGKSRAGQKQHDMSHLFHGLLINLIRRSDCQYIKPRGPPSENDKTDADTVDKAWRRWTDAEQKKRLAFLCFMWDTQHAVLFCQSLCMSAFELSRLGLPCSQTIWEARDAESWKKSWQESPSSDAQAFFLPTLKSYLVPKGTAKVPAKLSGLSRVLVLHGLISIAWDMQRRDQTSLGVVTRARDNSTSLGAGNWREILSAAYNTWKIDFDEYCAVVSAHQRRYPQVWGSRPPVAGGSDDDHREDHDDGTERIRTEFVAFAAAYKAVFYSAQALLNMEFLDVQIYAGARHIIGKPVQQRDYLRSEQVVKRWAADAGSDSGDSQNAMAAWHAARMLHEGVVGNQMSSEAMRLFHVPWCLYLATLTCWAFHHARPAHALRTHPGRGARRGFNDNNDFYDNDDDYRDDVEDLHQGGDEMVWHPRGEMEKLVASMAAVDEPGDLLSMQGRRTDGLVWTMADVLSQVRWGIVHAGVNVLRGLVPMRLINQYETL